MKTKSLLRNFFFSALLMLGASATSGAQCLAGFTSSVSGGTATFTNTSTGYTIGNFTWDFGDSQVGYGMNATHSYNVAGTYTVCLVLNDSLNSCTNTYCAPVTVTVGCNNLNVSITPTAASACSVCDGSAVSSVSGGTSPFAFMWSNSATTSSISSACVGQYGLTVTDANGCTTTANTTVACPDSCVASFGANVSGNDAYFYNSSNDTASNVNFQWIYGDASSYNGTTGQLHSYAAAGSYTVTLIMVDGVNGCTDTAVSVVTVGGPTSCGATFYMYPDSFNNLQWYLYSAVTGQAPITYLWDFGDTTTSTSANPGTHNYTYLCHHVVTLTITDGNGCSSMYADSSMSHRMSSASTMQFLTIVNTETATGIAEQKDLSGKTWPNPASDLINVSFNKPIVNGTLCLMDLTGKIISTQKINGSQATIDVSGLPAGIYNISLTSESAKWNEKEVIIR